MHTLTEDGYARFVAELEDLHAHRAPALQDMIRMRELGDLSENAGYRAAKSKLRRIDNRIRFLDKLLRSARVAKPASHTQHTITIGARVGMHDDTKTFRYLIVDSIESDVVHGKISVRSPLGRELVGKKVGDVIRVHTPQGVRIITIDSLEY